MEIPDEFKDDIEEMYYHNKNKKIYYTKTSYVFDLPEGTESIELEIWDKDITYNDLISTCTDIKLKKQTIYCGSGSSVLSVDLARQR